MVLKNRNGPTGNIALYFRDNVVRFEGLQPRTRSMEFA
ncbi:MAG: hypothetical protein IH956_02955 [Chloroflexi bacterium]|nr:hypothetical protein [Chloroflexota bacterium]